MNHILTLKLEFKKLEEKNCLPDNNNNAATISELTESKQKPFLRYKNRTFDKFKQTANNELNFTGKQIENTLTTKSVVHYYDLKNNITKKIKLEHHLHIIKNVFLLQK
jgi:hypothetical protein